MKPIPKRMLVHSVKYKPYSDGQEGASYGTEVNLTNVKVDDKKTLINTAEGQEIVGNAIMFYDYVNSSGLTSEPLKHSLITFKTRTYHIVDVEILYSNSNTPHHYEVILK